MGFDVTELLDEYERITQELAEAEDLDEVAWAEGTLTREFRLEAFAFGNSVMLEEKPFFAPPENLGDGDIEEMLTSSPLGPELPRILEEGLRVLSRTQFRSLWWNPELLWLFFRYLLNKRAPYWEKRRREANKPKTVE